MAFTDFGSVAPVMTFAERLARQRAMTVRQQAKVRGKGTEGQPRRRGGGGGGGLASIADLFDETGLPTRLPKNQQEALLFQLQGARAAAGFQRQATKSALATLRFGVGLTQRASPFSLAGALSPLLSQQASIQAGQQFQSPDFSFFLRPEAFGQRAGGAGRGLAPLGLARQVPQTVGLRFAPEPNDPFAAPVGGGGGAFNPFGGAFGPVLQDLGPELGGGGGGGGGGSLFDFGGELSGGFEGPGGGGLFRQIQDLQESAAGGGGTAGSTFVPGGGGFGGNLFSPAGDLIGSARGV